MLCLLPFCFHTSTTPQTLCAVFYSASNMAEGLMEISRLGINTVAGNL
jgi:hypothetical protein